MFESIYLPSLGDLAIVFLTLGVFAVIHLFGALVGGKNRLPTLDFLVGWGVAMPLLLLPTMFGNVPFWMNLFLFGAVFCALLFVQRQNLRPLLVGSARTFAWQSLSIAGLLYVMASALPYLWDDFSHWLINAKYLYFTQHLPTLAAPSPSGWPAYPYGQEVFVALVSLIRGTFTQNVSLLLSVYLAAVCGGLLASGWYLGKPQALPTRLPWQAYPLGTLLSLGLFIFWRDISVFSAYHDWSQAVTLGAAALVGISLWQACQNPAQHKYIPSFALQLSGLFLLLVNLKQIAPALIILLAVIPALSLLCTQHLTWRLKAALGIGIPLPSFLFWLGWKLWVHTNTAASSEFTLRASTNWNWEQLPSTLHTIGLHFVMAEGVLPLLGIIFLVVAFSGRRQQTAASLLAQTTLLVSLCYLGLLVFLYLAAFGPFEASYAGSFWRYYIAVAPLIFLTALCCLSTGFHLIQPRLPQRRLPWQHIQRFAGISGLALALAIPFIITSTRLRFDTDKALQFRYTMGQSIRNNMPAGSNVFVVEGRNNGIYTVQLRYMLFGHAHVIGNITHFQTPQDISEILKATQPFQFLYVVSHSHATQQAFPGTSITTDPAIYVWTGDKWRFLQAWPYSLWNVAYRNFEKGINLSYGADVP